MAIEPEHAAEPAAIAYPLTSRLAGLVPLLPEEVAALAALQAARRPVARNREIVRAGRTYDGVFMLLEGIGRRIELSGDPAGSLPLDRAGWLRGDVVDDAVDA